MTEVTFDYSELFKKLWLKYTLDRISVYPLLFLASPFILLGAWAIKFDGWFHGNHRGPIFYAEPRVTQGRLFRIIKFRTVTEKTVQWIRKRPESRSITSNEKKTCAGKFILKWYFDELPQLFNILKGEMSFVGPRPHIIRQHQEEISQGLRYRQILRAGLFGVPQACKRHPKYRAILERMARTHRPEFKLLNQLDGLYAKKCVTLPIVNVLLFDLSIIARCIVVIFRGSS
ncbi:MAG: sugar transferase [Candidatus Omnitrophota bacterium]|nr:MAG: sugar transferase [Candidatus Omnitrophota bacterium]